MTIEEKIYAVLSADATVTALVPATRIKPPGNWQNLARPYIVQFPVSEGPIRTHTEGLQDLRIWDFYQLDIFGDTYSSAKAVAEALRTALDGNQNGVDFQYRGQRYTGRETDEGIGVEHMIVEFFIAEAL